MYQSLATLLIVVAYCSFALAQNHLYVEQELPAVFGTYLKDRTDPEKWDTASFSFPNIAGDDYWYMAMVKLDDPNQEIYLLAAGYDGTSDSTLVGEIKKPMPNSTYVTPVGDYKGEEGKKEACKAYAKTEEDFVKKAKAANMKCQYFGSVRSIFSVYNGKEVIGTYLGVGLFGYQDTATPTLAGPIASVAKNPFSTDRIAFKVNNFVQ